MIIKREILKAAILCAGDDSSRSLNALQIHPSGAVVATDGHMLVNITDKHAPADEDFPTEGMPVLNGFHAATLLPVALAERLIKATPSKSSIPVLSCVRVGGDADGKPFACATDLSMPVTVDLAKATEGLPPFPQTDKIMAELGSETRHAGGTVKLALSAEMLAQLAKIATQVGRPKAANAVMLEIPIGEDYRAKSGDREVISAVRFSCGADGVKVDGAVMPCRI